VKTHETDFTADASYQTEEVAMSELTNKNEIAEALRRELEGHTIPRPLVALEDVNPETSSTDGNAINEFLDAVLEVIAYSIEQVLASVLARCVTGAVEQATRPLAEEIALLRIAFENDWKRENRQK
jgi:hypothetical protein